MSLSMDMHKKNPIHNSDVILKTKCCIHSFSFVQNCTQNINLCTALSICICLILTLILPHRYLTMSRLCNITPAWFGKRTLLSFTHFKPAPKRLWLRRNPLSHRGTSSHTRLPRCHTSNISITLAHARFALSLLCFFCSSMNTSGGVIKKMAINVHPAVPAVTLSHSAEFQLKINILESLLL